MNVPKTKGREWVKPTLVRKPVSETMGTPKPTLAQMLGTNVLIS